MKLVNFCFKYNCDVIILPYICSENNLMKIYSDFLDSFEVALKSRSKNCNYIVLEELIVPINTEMKKRGWVSPTVIECYDIDALSVIDLNKKSINSWCIEDYGLKNDLETKLKNT